MDSIVSPLACADSSFAAEERGARGPGDDSDVSDDSRIFVGAGTEVSAKGGGRRTSGGDAGGGGGGGDRGSNECGAGFSGSSEGATGSGVDKEAWADIVRDKRLWWFIAAFSTCALFTEVWSVMAPSCPLPPVSHRGGRALWGRCGDAVGAEVISL